MTKMKTATKHSKEIYLKNGDNPKNPIYLKKEDDLKVPLPSPETMIFSLIYGGHKKDCWGKN